VQAYHLIMTYYGFWLPNDPRGSWSDFVRSFELFLAGGQATKTDTRASVAGDRHDFQKRLAGKQALVRPEVILSGMQAKAVGDGFARFLLRSNCVVLACAVMPRHTHLVLERPPYLIEQAANLLKGAATTELSRCGLHPFADTPYSNGKLPTPWARHQWACYLNNIADIQRAIRYVESNPLKEGLPRQYWPFVTPYAG
jgi:REP element-mobilizing transposase RayT